MTNPKILTTKPSKDYELIDSGEGEKLERYGQYILRRPDPQALWPKNLTEQLWKQADASFLKEKENGKWKMKEEMKKEWEIEMGDLKFMIKPTPFKHVGIFPEQESNWIWIKEKIKTAGRPIKMLNLFGYTGGATLAGLSAGAEVVHVDGSKSAITWAKQNAELSGLTDKKVRWIEDDAKKFVAREIKRGNKYDAIVMDPPAFGHGAKNEVWKIEEDLIKLLAMCREILSDEPLFIIVNGYASGYSAIAYENGLKSITQNLGGEIESGELTIAEAKTERLLPAGIFARWFK
ncbi:MAG: class I SAM-dependent methyltransferase [Candidatus Paceibacterota bacterium]